MERHMCVRPHKPSFHLGVFFSGLLACDRALRCAAATSTLEAHVKIELRPARVPGLNAWVRTYPTTQFEVPVYYRTIQCYTVQYFVCFLLWGCPVGSFAGPGTYCLEWRTAAGATARKAHNHQKKKKCETRGVGGFLWPRNGPPFDRPLQFRLSSFVVFLFLLPSACSIGQFAPDGAVHCPPSETGCRPDCASSTGSDRLRYMTVGFVMAVRRRKQLRRTRRRRCRCAAEPGTVLPELAECHCGLSS